LARRFPDVPEDEIRRVLDAKDGHAGHTAAVLTNQRDDAAASRRAQARRDALESARRGLPAHLAHGSPFSFGPPPAAAAAAAATGEYRESGPFLGGYPPIAGTQQQAAAHPGMAAYMPPGSSTYPGMAAAYPGMAAAHPGNLGMPRPNVPAYGPASGPRVPIGQTIGQPSAFTPAPTQPQRTAAAANTVQLQLPLDARPGERMEFTHGGMRRSFHVPQNARGGDHISVRVS